MGATHILTASAKRIFDVGGVAKVEVEEITFVGRGELKMEVKKIIQVGALPVWCR